MTVTDSDFVSNPNTRTAHRGTREDGPNCGQTMQSEPATVDAENPVDVVVRYGLVPCSKCFEHTLRLSVLYQIDHTANVIRTDREDVLEKLPWSEVDDAE